MYPDLLTLLLPPGVLPCSFSCTNTCSLRQEQRFWWGVTLRALPLPSYDLPPLFCPIDMLHKGSRKEECWGQWCSWNVNIQWPTQLLPRPTIRARVCFLLKDMSLMRVSCHCTLLLASRSHSSASAQSPVLLCTPTPAYSTASPACPAPAAQPLQADDQQRKALQQVKAMKLGTGEVWWDGLLLGKASWWP